MVAPALPRITQFFRIFYNFTDLCKNRPYNLSSCCDATQ